MYQALLIIYLLVSIALIIFILLQQGEKGANAGASFGGGASPIAIFGSTVASNFLSK